MSVTYSATHSLLGIFNIFIFLEGYGAFKQAINYLKELFVLEKHIETIKEVAFNFHFLIISLLLIGFLFF